MVEIIIMIGVVGWFFRTAQECGSNGFLWAAMGALSYYLPVILSGRFIFPALLRPILTYENQFLLSVANIGASVAVGIICCIALKRLLSARAQAYRETQQHAGPAGAADPI